VADRENPPGMACYPLRKAAIEAAWTIRVLSTAQEPHVTEIIDSLADVSDRYDALFCDLWGCVHDGVRAFPEAVEALRAFKAGAARCAGHECPPPPVQRRAAAERLGVPDDCWDAIATSGDAARLRCSRASSARRSGTWANPMTRRSSNRPRYSKTRQRSRGSISRTPRASSAPARSIRMPILRSCGRSSCSPRRRACRSLCANPDIVVDRGESREWCAGALAELYTEMGGESLYFGKPHPPIYDLARRRMDQIGRIVPDDRILAVGDGIFTDIQGGMGENIDTLFITGGLAREETGTDPSGRPDIRSWRPVSRQGGTGTQLRDLDASIV
jgi:ribonucleotide monophosphatase NagD (HAD superfamily)